MMLDSIKIVQLEVLPGLPAENTTAMLAEIEIAKREGVEILIFSELCIPGYLLGDEWERRSFLRECEAQGEKIKIASQGICIIFGNVGLDWDKKNEDGRVRKFNALFAAEDGTFIHNTATGHPFFIKTLMPNYREFDDNRHFFDPRKLAFELDVKIEDIIEVVPTKRLKLGCLLCEDGWDDDYNLSPLKILHKKGAEIFVNLSCSPYTHNKNHKRNRVFANHAQKYATPLVYVNNTGIQDNGKTVYTFDGASCAYDADGKLIFETRPFQTNAHAIQLSQQAVAATPTLKHDDIGDLFAAIRYGTEKFMQRLGVKKVVIGVSGGIDSAVVAAIYRQIIPVDNLLLVSMPGPFTSQTTRKLSKQLADNLGCYFKEVPIQASVDVSVAQFDKLALHNTTKPNEPITLSVSDFVLENIQARDRSARVLAGVSAAFGGVFTCNANKSEMTVGYSTLYGDLGGYLANIADLWKAEVYALANYLNHDVYKGDAIPQGIIDIVPSAELSAKQNVDANQGDPLNYPYHDRLFASWVEFWDRATPEDILNWVIQGQLEQVLGMDAPIKTIFANKQAFVNDLEYWWRQYQGMAIAKRIQAPPILAVKRRAFGFDHREAQLGPRFTGNYQNLKTDFLSTPNW